MEENPKPSPWSKDLTWQILAVLETSLPSSFPAAYHSSHTGLLDVLQTFQASFHLRAFAQCVNPPILLCPLSLLCFSTQHSGLGHYITNLPITGTSPLECKHHEGKGFTCFVHTSSPLPRSGLTQGGLPHSTCRMNEELNEARQVMKGPDSS